MFIFVSLINLKNCLFMNTFLNAQANKYDWINKYGHDGLTIEHLKNTLKAQTLDETITDRGYTEKHYCSLFIHTGCTPHKRHNKQFYVK